MLLLSIRTLFKGDGKKDKSMTRDLKITEMMNGTALSGVVGSTVVATAKNMQNGLGWTVRCCVGKPFIVPDNVPVNAIRGRSTHMKTGLTKTQAISAMRLCASLSTVNKELT